MRKKSPSFRVGMNFARYTNIFIIGLELFYQPSLKEESFLREWNGFSTTHSPKICLTANA